MFVLTIAADYEGETLLGVYSSRELAEAASQQFLVDTERELCDFEQFVIREVAVDADAEYRF